MVDIVKLVKEAKAGRLRPERDDDFDLTEEERENGGRRYLGAQLVTLRSRAAAAMKVHGASYDDIAETLEYESAAHARNAVEGALAATASEGKDHDALRALSSLRLEALLKSTFTHALNEHHPDQLSYLRAAGGFIDRINQLHGLNAPQRIQMVNPDAQEFERAVTIVLEAGRAGDPRESDPFALDSVPDITSIEAGETDE